MTNGERSLTPPERTMRAEATPIAYRPTDAAQILGISRAKLYQLMDEGQIVGRKLGRRTIIPHVELERYVASLPLRDVGS